jgi:SAM-dependent methyltransferase
MEMRPEGPVKIHYDRFLARHYLWMAGGFERNAAANRQFFSSHQIRPGPGGIAIDLGAGCGFQSIPLEEAGFRVTAVDFCEPLLDELRLLAPATGIVTITGDIMDFPLWAGRRPELITCMGDTLTHMPDRDAVMSLLRQCYGELVPGGRLIVSLRDYSAGPEGSVAVVPVSRDRERIFLCRLEYLRDHVRVTDIVFSHQSGKWERFTGDYTKLRLTPDLIRVMIERAGFRIEFAGLENRMVVFIGVKAEQ